ncbi:MAG: 3-oxoacyl-ACP synthase, partial [Deltaproteobacteria bacterium]|nr:3-oxoacyl-ACP synthase [Deltaproteobacteria bacterium]
MANISAAITGIECSIPDYILTNQQLEKMVDTSEEWITTRTGIKERRILKGEGLGTSDMAVDAVKKILLKTGTSADEVDLLICATVTPDMLFPATANIISDKAGIKKASSFDINAACSGFIFALATAEKYVK